MNLVRTESKAMFALLLLSFGGYAAAAPINPRYVSTDLTSLNLEELMQLEVGGASKRPRKLTEAAAAVYIITKDDIKRHGYRNLSEALRSVIGLYVSSDRNYDYLGVRGFSRPGDYNTRILLLLNGHRFNDPNYDEAPIGENLPVDIESLQQIEVIKGPSSAVWGSNALLAVINLVTERGSEMKGSRVTLEYGNYNRAKSYAGYGTKLLSGLEFSLAAAALNSGGQKHIYFPEFDSPAANYGVASGLDGERAFRGHIQAAYEGLSLLINGGTRKKNVPTASYGTVFNRHGTYTIDQSARFDLSYMKELDPAKRTELFARVYYDRVRYDGRYLYDSEAPWFTTFYDSSGSNLLGTELRYTRDLFSNLALVVGAEFQRGYELRFTNYEQPVYRKNIDLESSLNIGSLYGELELAALENLRFVAGLRFDNYSTCGEEWSPRGAMIYKPFSETTFKFLYGRAFRAPNNYERNYADQTTALPNPNLKPERLQSLEFIAEQRIGASLLSLNLFKYRLRNIITQTSSDEGWIQFQNLNSATSRGIEFQIQSRFSNDITTHGGFSLLHTEDSAGNRRLGNSPKQLATAGLSVPLWDKRFYLSPEFQFVGSRRTLQDSSTGSWKVANLTLISDKLLPPLILSLGLYDLLDETRYASGNEEHVQNKIPQEGRSLRCQAECRF